MSEQYVQFFTASILKWKPILFNNNYKQLILDSLKYLISQRRIILYGFVIMPNHIHLIWQMRDGQKQSDVQRDFLRFTGQQILKDFPPLLVFFTNKPLKLKSNIFMKHTNNDIMLIYTYSPNSATIPLI